MTHQNLWPHTSERSSQRSRTKSILFVLSGEPTGIPEAEARTLVTDVDPEARFAAPVKGLLVADTGADPQRLEARVAFSRRVGVFVPDGEFDLDQLSLLRRGTYRVRVFGQWEEKATGEEDEEEKEQGEREEELISSIAEKVDGRVSLEKPDFEVSAYVGGRAGSGAYIAITRPHSMRQGWATRRPRSRAFFHPSAIFPKLSRALVNFSGVQPGEAFLDPFCGTGSLLIEASIIDAEPIGADIARKMVRGARRNALKYAQQWLGIVLANARRLPLARVDAIATDIPYGRASSLGGLETDTILRSLLEEGGRIIPKGRKLVVMHPKSLEADAIAEESGTALGVEQHLEIYVHRTLTRRVTVFRRGDLRGEMMNRR